MLQTAHVTFLYANVRMQKLSYTSEKRNKEANENREEE